MSVFTKVRQPRLAEALAGYEIGPLRRFEGIGTGIENSNYHVWCGEHRYVLTLLETVDPADLPYFQALTDFLADRGLPCPRTLVRRDGRRVFELHGRAAVLVEYLPGRSASAPDTAQCESLGRTLGLMHRHGAAFDRRRPNPRGDAWRREALRRLQGLWPATDDRLARAELAQAELAATPALPRGPCHCDLFRDNVLFESGRLSGLLDFYYACDEYLLYDLAIAVNDWCHRDDGTLDAARYAALLRGYAGQRRLVAAERRAWNAMLRLAALRFWLSRSLDRRLPRAGELTYAKDPEEYRRILLAHRQHALSLPREDAQ